MSTKEVLEIMLAFGTFVLAFGMFLLALLTYIKKK